MGEANLIENIFFWQYKVTQINLTGRYRLFFSVILFCLRYISDGCESQLVPWEAHDNLFNLQL